MRIALGQMNATVGDFAGNVARALDYATSARRAGADLLVLPAFALSGAPLHDLLESDAFVEDARIALESFAVSTPVPALLAHPLPAPDMAGDVQAVFCSEGVVTVLGCDIFGEGDDRLYSTCAFKSFPQVSVAGERVAVSLFAPLPASIESAYVAGADTFVVLDARPWRGHDHFDRDEIRDVARSAGLPTAWVNLVGGSDSDVHFGGSVGIAADGSIQTGGFLLDEALVIFDTDPAAAPGLIAETLSEDEIDWAALTLATRDYVTKSGFSDVLVGLSGGLDSAVVTTIAVDALGADSVQGVLMPGPFTSTASTDDALALAENLGIDTRMVPIDTPLVAFSDALGIREGLAHENLQARIRGTYLMSLSNAEGALVLNTGNKSEAAVGYSTLHGDTVGAFAPLADVYKMRVFELARWRADRSASIPASSIEKPPTAELRAGQLDSDSLPPYDVLDAILALHLDEGLGAAEIVAQGLDVDTVVDVLRRTSAAEYKRRLEPLGPTMSYSAFHDDRLWPVVNRWFDRG